MLQTHTKCSQHSPSTNPNRFKPLLLLYEKRGLDHYTRFRKEFVPNGAHVQYTSQLPKYKYKFFFVCSCYRPGVAQKVGRGIALLFHDRGTRRGWVVGSTPRPHFTPGKEPVPILQEAGWASGSVWRGGKSRPHRDSIPVQIKSHLGRVK